MKILIVGAGAVGGYFGGRLLQAGRDVTLFVRPQRAAELALKGLSIKSPHGDVHLPNPPTVTAEKLSGSSFDIILLSCKAPALDRLIPSFAAAAGPATAIIPLLNGMRHLDQLAERFGRDHVLGGVCRISAGRDAEGSIVQNATFQEIVFGECDGKHSDRVRKIAAALSNAGFDVQVSSGILQDMWDKWVFIAALAGVTCLMRGSVGDIEAAGGRDITVAMLDEAAAIAKAAGFPTPPEPYSRYRSMLTGAGSVIRASMLRDIENGAETEAAHIIGDLLEKAARQNIPASMLEIANIHLKVYEAQRKART